ncbi:MAG: hypothetical protein OQJ96_09565 [Flavobacteriales bacterium]|nr:hypothetical protein [Flavobacteriales bacterium]MCW8912068.1 hypothetical protein [Flavobacteriales bacterium]MCW8936708.1 hypothetical protein [Flavobacteriales bacterium]MCW8941469.1 hypothetical protein [Flavobacteriales bacterium]MCW8967113.1 hypothetical protein [Flavobacteriales bacterium]
MRTSILIFILTIINFYGFSQETPIIESNLGDTTSYEDVTIPLIGGCSLGCALGWKMTASSNLESQGVSTYGIENIEDGDQKTAWIEGVNGYGIGEKINITFISPDSLDILFYEIGLNNGYCKSKDIWKANSRVKKARLLKNGEEKLILNFKDTMFSQIFRWDTNYITVTNKDIVTIEILEVYKGDKYEDTAISDLYLMGAH